MHHSDDSISITIYHMLYMLDPTRIERTMATYKTEVIMVECCLQCLLL
jgi:hypothetical protein